MFKYGSKHDAHIMDFTSGPVSTVIYKAGIERHIRKAGRIGQKRTFFGLLISFSQAESCRDDDAATAAAAAAAIVLRVQPVTTGLTVVLGAAAEPPRGQQPVITDYGVVMRGGGVFSGADPKSL